MPAHPLLGVASGGRDPIRLAVMVGAETSRPGRAVSPAGSTALERGRGPGPETSAAITVPTAASKRRRQRQRESGSRLRVTSSSTYPLNAAQIGAPPPAPTLEQRAFWREPGRKPRVRGAALPSPRRAWSEETRPEQHEQDKGHAAGDRDRSAGS